MRARGRAAGLLLAGLVAGMAGPGTRPARADPVTYDFVGQCTDCSGTGVGALVLDGYTPGTPLTEAVFVSFSYASNLVAPVTVDASGLLSLSGSLDTLPGSNPVSLLGAGTDGVSFLLFDSYASGFWCVGGDCFSNAQDYGPSHVWSVAATAVPEPAPLALLAAGLAATVLVRRRRAG